MAWDNKILLTRIIEIQNITIEYKKKGLTQRRIYDNIIYPRFIISESTYNNYLSRNAKKELKNLEDNSK